MRVAENSSQSPSVRAVRCKRAALARRGLHFSKSGIDKSSPEYIKMISGVEDIQTNSDERRLEAMVREQLKEEFPNIENMKSYELLVDAVMHNLKKKQLQATEDLDIE